MHATEECVHKVHVGVWSHALPCSVAYAPAKLCEHYNWSDSSLPWLHSAFHCLCSSLPSSEVVTAFEVLAHSRDFTSSLPVLQLHRCRLTFVACVLLKWVESQICSMTVNQHTWMNCALTTRESPPPLFPSKIWLIHWRCNFQFDRQGHRHCSVGVSAHLLWRLQCRLITGLFPCCILWQYKSETYSNRPIHVRYCTTITTSFGTLLALFLGPTCHLQLITMTTAVHAMWLILTEAWEGSHSRQAIVYG